jgi:ankyrin repeat protein
MAIRKYCFGLCMVLLPLSVFAQELNDAISKRDTAAAIALIKKGADVNALDKFGNSLLMSACRWGNDTTVSFLLRHGAKPDDPRSPKGRTPLIVACAYYSGTRVCSMLLAYGADVNATAADGTTALMLAAQNAKLDVVELLLKKGAKANMKDKSGKTAHDYVTSAEIPDYFKNSVKDSRIDKEAVIGLLKNAK